MKKLFAAGSNSGMMKYADRLGKAVVELLDDEYGMIAEYNVGTESLNIEVFAEPEDDFAFYNYIQPFEDIQPAEEDIDSDAAEIADAIMTELYEREKTQQVEDRTIDEDETSGDEYVEDDLGI